MHSVEAAVEEILAANGTALAVRADELDVERLFDETIEALGGVDVVVHAATRGTAVVDRQAARQLRHGGGIVTVSSCEVVAPALAASRERATSRSTASRRAPATPAADHDVADLVAFLDRWRGRRGE